VHSGGDRVLCGGWLLPAAGQSVQRGGLVLRPELRRPGVRRRRLRQYGKLRGVLTRPDLQHRRPVSGAGQLLAAELPRLLYQQRAVPDRDQRASLRHGRGGVRELFRIDVDVPERDVRLHPAVPGQGLRPGWVRRDVRDVSVRPNLQCPERSVHPVHGQWPGVHPGQCLLLGQLLQRRLCPAGGPVRRHAVPAAGQGVRRR
jgi:hypothetical protein